MLLTYIHSPSGASYPSSSSHSSHCLFLQRLTSSFNFVLGGPLARRFGIIRLFFFQKSESEIIRCSRAETVFFISIRHFPPDDPNETVCCATTNAFAKGRPRQRVGFPSFAIVGYFSLSFLFFLYPCNIVVGM